MEKVGVTDSESQENDSSPHEETRRDFLMISTVSVGAIGAGLAAIGAGIGIGMMWNILQYLKELKC